MSNDEALAALRAKIEVGWKVEIINHDYLADSRDDVTVTAVYDDSLILTTKKPWSSQGGSFPSSSFGWDGDREVDGRTVRLYHTPPPHTGKSRRLIRTYVFSPPREY